MNAKDAILTALSGTQSLVPMYLSDLSDADLLVRPVPGANHIAWQIGHLINSEVMLLNEQLPGVAFPKLPDGFAAAHSDKGSKADADKAFLTKDKYLALFSQVREATKAAVAKLADADFDKPNKGRMEKFAPTLGALVLLSSNHTLMHAGQFTVVRRKLGKPVVF